MPALVITETFADGQVLFEADLDNIRNSVQDFFNNTKIDADNLQTSIITQLIRTGSIVLFGGTIAPTGWLMCDGAEISKTAFAVLYGVIGDSFFTTAGAGNFNIPDMARRAPIAYDPGIFGPGPAVGTVNGSETHVLTLTEMPQHTHTVAAHRHTQQGKTATGSVRAGPVATGGTPHADLTMTTPTTSAAATLDNVGSGTAHNNVQPSLVVNYIIKT